MLKPTDDDFDDMHHALGRPEGPHAPPRRNYYVVGVNSDTAQRFALLGFWRLVGKMNEGRDGVFKVTDEGIALTMHWVAESQRKAGLRRYEVSGRDLTARVVVARSRAAAKFAVWREISDVWPDGFGDFVRRVDMRAVLA